MAVAKGKEFGKLKYNPIVLSNQKRMWIEYPDFAKRPLLCSLPPDSEELSNLELIDLDKMLRFIVLFVDPLSPYASERDFDIRERLCMKALGYGTSSKFYKHISDISEYYVEVLLEYFKMIHNIRYEHWFSTVTSYRQLNRDLLNNAVTLRDRATAMAIQDKTVKEIETLEHSLFPDEMTKNILAKKATQGLSGYAEKYALTLEEIK